MTHRTYYLKTINNWYTFSETRWKFIGDERPMSSLIIVASDCSNILTLAQLSPEERQLLEKAKMQLHLVDNRVYTLYLEEAKA